MDWLADPCCVLVTVWIGLQDIFHSILYSNKSLSFNFPALKKAFAILALPSYSTLTVYAANQRVIAVPATNQSLQSCLHQRGRCRRRTITVTHFVSAQLLRSLQHTRIQIPLSQSHSLPSLFVHKKHSTPPTDETLSTLSIAVQLLTTRTRTTATLQSSSEDSQSVAVTEFIENNNQSLRFLVSHGESPRPIDDDKGCRPRGKGGGGGWLLRREPSLVDSSLPLLVLRVPLDSKCASAQLLCLLLVVLSCTFVSTSQALPGCGFSSLTSFRQCGSSSVALAYCSSCTCNNNNNILMIVVFVWRVLPLLLFYSHQ